MIISNIYNDLLSYSLNLLFYYLRRSVPEPPTWDEDFLGDTIVSRDKAHSYIISWSTPEFNGDPIDYYLLRYCPVSNYISIFLTEKLHNY